MTLWPRRELLQGLCSSLLDLALKPTTWVDFEVTLSDDGRDEANWRNFLQQAATVRLTFLGKSTQGGGSPTLFATNRDTYVVQGWRVAGDETRVEIPKKLLGYLEPSTQLGSALQDAEPDTCILSGAGVTDTDALAQMDIPDHETCVEVGKVRRGTADEATAR